MLLDPPAGWHPDWLQSSASKKIFAALGESSVRFVGGCVRDSLLGQEVADIDLATTHEPTETVVLLEAAGAKVVPTGLAHGTVTAILNNQSFEITSLRSDVSTDGRHATVAFTEDWREDAQRRDFTINALYATTDGRIFDPFGGLEDLKNRRVRFIGSAVDRIKEDALRIFRFFRFSARFGTSLDTEGLAACGLRAADAKNLSRERVRDELLKLLSIPDPRAFLREMQAIQLLPKVGNSPAVLNDLNFAVETELSHGRNSAPETRLAFCYSRNSAKEIGKAFRLSKKQQHFISDVREAGQNLDDDTSVRPKLYRLGVKAVEDALASFSGNLRRKFMQEINNWESPVFPVSGADMIEIGFEQTPALGARLKHLEKEWIESDFQLSKEELLRLTN